MQAFKFGNYTYSYPRIMLICSILISLIGILFIYSAEEANQGKHYLVQFEHLIAGLIIAFIISKIRFELIMRFSPFLFLFGVLLLISVLIFGKTVHGSKSWFDFGIFAYQPSETMKIFYILFSAYVVRTLTKPSFINIAILTILMLLCVSLIALQPDFGTMLVFVVIFLLFLFMLNIQFLYILYAFFLFLNLLVFRVIVFYFSMKENPIPKFFIFVDQYALYVFLFGVFSLFFSFFVSFFTRNLMKIKYIRVFLVLLSLFSFSSVSFFFFHYFFNTYFFSFFINLLAFVILSVLSVATRFLSTAAFSGLVRVEE